MSRRGPSVVDHQAGQSGAANGVCLGKYVWCSGRVWVLADAELCVVCGMCLFVGFFGYIEFPPRPRGDTDRSCRGIVVIIDQIFPSWIFTCNLSTPIYYTYCSTVDGDLPLRSVN